MSKAAARDHPVGFALFDATGTLMYLKEPVGETYSRYAVNHGLKVGSPEDLDREFKRTYTLMVIASTSVIDRQNLK